MAEEGVAALDCTILVLSAVCGFTLGAVTLVVHGLTAISFEAMDKSLTKLCKGERETGLGFMFKTPMKQLQLAYQIATTSQDKTSGGDLKSSEEPKRNVDSGGTDKVVREPSHQTGDIGKREALPSTDLDGEQAVRADACLRRLHQNDHAEPSNGAPEAGDEPSGG
tara:strand:- start:3973 stop:4470 length:498 start_codon:yes stop_codon:yes gene_type:complete